MGVANLWPGHDGEFVLSEPKRTLVTPDFAGLPSDVDHLS